MVLLVIMFWFLLSLTIQQSTSFQGLPRSVAIANRIVVHRCPNIIRLKSSKKSVENLRLERILSNRGLGSRSEVARFIQQGRVSIAGKIIRSCSGKFPSDVIVEVDGVQSTEMPLIMVYHKPVGMQSTIGDPLNRLNLQNITESDPILKLYHPVGRLDADTSGLLLFSRNGDLTQYLLHPSNKVLREYEAIVQGEVKFEELGAKLAAGVTTSLGSFKLNLLKASTIEYKPIIRSRDKPISTLKSQESNPISQKANNNIKPVDNIKISSSQQVRVVDLRDEQYKDLDSEDELVSESSSQDTGIYSKVTVSCSEGKYRMVRRVLHNAGHSVVELRRIKYGEIHLSDLQEGAYRPCSSDEKEWISQLKY